MKDWKLKLWNITSKYKNTKIEYTMKTTKNKKHNCTLWTHSHETHTHRYKEVEHEYKEIYGTTTNNAYRRKFMFLEIRSDWGISIQL